MRYHQWANAKLCPVCNSIYVLGDPVLFVPLEVCNCSGEDVRCSDIQVLVRPGHRPTKNYGTGGA